jgi:tetratricopeptide (TPR) repeat protein
MVKYIFIGVLALLVAGSWYLFVKSGDEGRDMEKQIELLMEAGDPEEKIPKLESELRGLEGESTFNGILLTFLSAGLIGIVFVTMLLPMLAEKFTQAVYESGEEVERDIFRDARVLMAQGQWEEAIKAFTQVTVEDPLNRMAYIEIAKIQSNHLEDPQAAITTLREAIEAQQWPMDDAAALMFRLADLYDANADDRAAAAIIYEQMMEQFPGTRHAANARAKLYEWGIA